MKDLIKKLSSFRLHFLSKGPNISDDTSYLIDVCYYYTVRHKSKLPSDVIEKINELSQCLEEFYDDVY